MEIIALLYYTTLKVLLLIIGYFKTIYFNNQLDIILMELNKKRSIGSRLKEFITYLGVSIRKFEQQCDITLGIVSKAIAKDTDFGIQVLVKILDKHPKLNLVWLLNGQGEMLNVTHTQYKSRENGEFIADISRINDFRGNSTHGVSMTMEQLKRLENTELKIKALQESVEYFKQSDQEKTKQIEQLLKIMNQLLDKQK